ncbi:MAG: patatin-like phospholipase family protein, partial [Myxococcota bacterium]|nr:patatin-like phospholipase family protein [Myxococcota bacterium]
GGGGAGLMHLGVFSLFNELGHCPELIVGSSMGSIMGALRAIDRDYDPINTALSLPREIS